MTGMLKLADAAYVLITAVLVSVALGYSETVETNVLGAAALGIILLLGCSVLVRLYRKERQ